MKATYVGFLLPVVRCGLLLLSTTVAPARLALQIKRKKTETSRETDEVYE